MTPGYTIAHTECSLGWGGQEIRVFTEMQAMRERGHRLLLCAPERSTIFAKTKADGFTTVAINDTKPSFPATVMQLRSLFRREGVQVVNPHSSRDGWLAGLGARLAGVPLIIRSRHIEVDYPNRLTSRYAFHHLPHHVLTTSDRISQGLITALSLEPNRVSCVPTGIDLKRFDRTLTGKLHQELNLAPETPLVAMICVLRSWKGHEVFLTAAKQILERHPETRFVVAGEGPRRPYLEQFIREQGLGTNVHLIGHRDDVPNLLASARIVVLPSLAHEGIPQIILQAQAMAKPVVGTIIGGIPEVVTNEETGLLVPPSQPGDLANAIVRLLDDPGLATRLGAQAHARALRDYSTSRMCERLEEIYGRYLSRLPR